MAQNSPAYDRVRKRFDRAGRTNYTKDLDFQEVVRKEISESIEVSNIITKVPKGIVPDEIVREMLKSGLVIVGGKGCGKSNAAKIIMRKIINKEILSDIYFRCKIYDTCQNWMHEFEHIPYIEVVDGSYDYSMVDNENLAILYDIGSDNVDAIMNMIGESVRIDFAINRELKKCMDGEMKNWNVYCIEEAQNVLGSFSLNRDNGKFWLKAISEGRNFNMAFIFIGQRLADISTKVIERAQGYLFGKTTGDNDKNKIRRICGKSIGIHEKVSNLEQGEFIYWNGAKGWELQFDEYISEVKPYRLGEE